MARKPTYAELERRLAELEARPVQQHSVDDPTDSDIADARAGKEDLLLSDTRLRIVRNLAFHADSGEQAARVIATVLSGNPQDLPFVLIYRVDREARRAWLVASTGMEPGGPASPVEVDFASEPCPWSLDSVVASGAAVQVGAPPQAAGPLHGATGVQPPAAAQVLPVPCVGSPHPSGVLVLGIRLGCALDGDYREFHDLVARQVVTILGHAHAIETQRRKAQELEELNVARMTFFSNASREFRTPLTLILGQTEELLQDAELTNASRHNALQVVRRNAMRLLKLVNALLDFTRMDTRRLSASLEPVDLSSFTADLASNFRSAIEKAGIRLLVDCPELDGPVYVDRVMYEKIVLNLISNALKFTFQGEIEVKLERADECVKLTVRDTGVGIAAEEMPYLFERFRQVRHVGGRTHEGTGTGTGLALVHELVKLLGGEIQATSVLRTGSAFTVSLPLGRSPLPIAQVGSDRGQESSAVPVGAYVEEALRWLPEGQPALDPAVPDGAVGGDASSQSSARSDTFGARILVAEDDADMREYVTRLLCRHYDVEGAADGMAAMESISRCAPDLVLSDVMMPRLDGLGLLRELRSNPQTASIPLILLSAGAGEDARVEGLNAGADDYCTKPLNSRELLARVDVHLKMARVRRAAARREHEFQLQTEEAREALRASESRFHNLVEALPLLVWTCLPDGECDYISRQWVDYTGMPTDGQLGFGWLQQVHPEDRERTLSHWRDTLREGTTFHVEFRIRRHDGAYHWFKSRAVLLRDATGKVTRWFGSSTDVDDMKQAEQALARRTRELERSNADLDQFAGVASHDLQEPLRKIRAFGDLLKTRHASGLDDQARDYLERMLSASKRMHVLINDLLSFSQLTSRAQTFVSVELMAVARDAISDLAARVDEVGGSVVVSDLPTIEAVPTQMRQLFQNLIGNGLKFRRPGVPPRVKVSARSFQEVVDTWPSGEPRTREMCELVFEDNGIGFDLKYLERIFAIFQRLHVRTEYEGSGVGLATCRRIVLHHGGRITATSTIGQGSAFVCTLPVRQVDAGA